MLKYSIRYKNILFLVRNVNYGVTLKKSTILFRKSHKQITDLTEMHKFVAKLGCYKKPKNYQRMHKINVYSTFVIFPDSSPNVT